MPRLSFLLWNAVALLVSFLRVGRGQYFNGTAAADVVSCTFCPSGEATLDLDEPIAAKCLELDKIAGSFPSESENCTKIQSIASLLCDCPPIGEPKNPCQLCNGNTTVALPEKKLKFLASDFYGIENISCGLFEEFLRSIDADTDKCREAQLTRWTCGCAVPENSCDLCRGESMADPTIEFRELGIVDYLGVKEWEFQPLTCELYQSLLLTNLTTSDSLECPYHQAVAYVCGCNAEDIRFREQLLNWLPRTAAIFSFMGSSFIIWDILLNKRAEQQTMQYSLLVCMSIIDCMSSIAWTLSALPIEEYYGLDGYRIFGARGTRASCKAQGFFIQLGLTSPFYNCTLAFYYLLTISFSWSESRIRKYKMCFLGIPFAVGLAFALAALPFYDYSVTMCYVVDEEVFFLVVPIATVIFFATWFLIKIWLDVYHQEHRVQRWRATGHHDLTKRVFWQAFWYLMCFYASWPIIIALIFLNTGLYSNFGFLCLAMAVAPLQGALNCIAYSRLRILRHLGQLRSTCCGSERLDQILTYERTGDRETANTCSSPSVVTERAPPIVSATQREADETSTEEANVDSR